MNIEKTIELTQELIAIPSVAPNEAVVLKFTAQKLAELGFELSLQDVAQDRYNILATRSDNPEIVFTTHLDVVPVSSEQQFTPELREGRIYGRGSCDAKGIAAAMIAAASGLKDARNLALLFVVGEEVDGIGAKTAAKLLPENSFRFLVNGEPTEGRLASGHKGGLGFTVKLEGKAAHSGYPESGIDANRGAVELANKLYAADFGKAPALGEATVNVGQISGGKASNIIAESCELSVLIRTVLNSDETRSRLEQVLQGTPYSVSYEMNPIQLMTLEGFETSSFAYCTDLPFLAPLAERSLMYGPGSIHQAHTADEFLDITELERAVEDYKAIYRELNSRI